MNQKRFFSPFSPKYQLSQLSLCQPARLCTLNSLDRVSSEKEKSFREIFFFATISLRFRISFAREKCENFRFIREISLQSVSQKNAKKIMRKFCEKIMRKFRIICCSYNTHGYHEIFAFRIFASFIFSWETCLL